MLTLEQFKATGCRYDVAKALEITGTDADMHQPTATGIWLYQDGLAVEELSDGFYLLIYRDEWTGTREELETRLYFDFYVSECVDPSETDTTELAAMYGDWLKWRGKPEMSADELLHEECINPPELRDVATRENVQWLIWFIEVWEKVQLREDGKGFGGRA